ncbi:MAG: helix-turn-helix domain-containing protein [Desulfobacteraceae bacterium]|nr:helix-turn-helix domain-containing protein [Desulfobacteraceae bacterium]
MMKFKFKKNKYGKELLIDCGLISGTKDFVKDETPFFVSFHEIIFITKGKGRFKLDDEEIPFERGTLLLLPRNKWRQWAVIDELIDGYFLIFEEEFIANFFNDALFLYRFHYFYNNSTPSFIQTDEEIFGQMTVKLGEIQMELKELRNDSHHFLRSILYYLLIRINRIYEREFNLNDELFQEGLTLRFRKLLERNFRDRQRVSDYADMLQVSKSHLNKVLNIYFGKSCSEIIKERLVADIKKELLFSNKSIAEIGYGLNFSEPGNLIRFFKKMTRTTPREYRLLNSK